MFGLRRRSLLVLGFAVLGVLTALDFVYAANAFSDISPFVEKDWSTAETVAAWAFLPVLGAWGLLGLATLWLTTRWALRRRREAK